MKLKANEINIPMGRVRTKIYIHTFEYKKKKKRKGETKFTWSTK